MVGVTAQSREELLEQVKKLHWAHTIDLGNGVVTPGQWGNHNPVLWKAIEDIDFRGKKVLDIGCWDGLWSFEAEKRGAAEVYATDLITHRNNQHRTFEFAHHVLNSKAKYHPRLSVYDVESLGVTDFDVVIFAGVYYHLKDPVRALCTLRRVMKEGAILIVEGAVIDLDRSEPEATIPAVNPQGRLRHHLRKLLRLDTPPPAAPPQSSIPNDCFARFYYRNAFVFDNSNWWVPTIPCLRQWVECNFFEIDRDHGKWNAGGENMRCTLSARAVCRKDPLYSREEDDLRPFDLNMYSGELSHGD
jgi:tRNA (mo5U34)-methyltransferase